ncbi:hypothetical protein Rhopal_002888-T1 [Rhodotorula paludigena]|uniref:DUF7137 domain-containing protein n=1 Tax=Rhodotorula paludigena TaxID=86838 RepID=A0AAV5GKX0_9BASI|nr:hypothetical protein Rhopal_002888-T1 [Rhodotorula paludigena]
MARLLRHPLATPPPLVPPALVQPEPAHPLERRQAVTNVVTVVDGDTTRNVSIPNTAAAGGLTYLTPAATAGASYYKIAPSNQITFGWNYTSLYVTPSMLTFEARCSANGFTYPVGPTTGIPASETSLVWDPWEYAQSADALPFAQASYTLRVYDERGPDATAEAGRFNGANAIINFAMYSPAAYTPLSEGWSCAGCSAAARVVGGVGAGVWGAVAVSAAAVLIGGAGVLGR